MPLPPQPPYNPDWLNRVTGPNIQYAAFSGSVPFAIGRQPNLTFVGALVESDPINGQNVITFQPLGLPLIGVGGTTVTLIPGNSYTFSSSIGANPYSHYVVGNIDPNLPNALVAVGEGGTSVIPSAGQLIISSSLGVSASFFGQGGTSVTTNGTNVFISSSLGQSSSFFGVAGTSVSVVDNSQVNVSSSIYADKYASFAMVTPQPGEPNSRTLTAGPNISIQDNGPASQVVIVGFPTSIFNNGIGQVGTTNFICGNQGIFMVSTSLGALTMSLPTPATSSILFKDCQGSSSVNPFTIMPTAGAKIDNLSASYTYYINFGTLRLICDGANWYTW